MEFRDKPMENLIRLQEKDICKISTPCCWRASRSWALTRRCAIRWCLPATASSWWICRGHGHAAAAFVLPYRKVLHYGIQTAGFGDPLQASQLTVCFADGHEAKFGFIGQKDLFQVANAISARIL